MTKAFRKAIMKRSEIENKSVKNKASELYHKKKKKKKKEKKENENEKEIMSLTTKTSR